MSSGCLALPPALSHCSPAFAHCLQRRSNLATSGMGGCLLHQHHLLWSHSIYIRWILIQAWLQQASSGLVFLTLSAKTEYITSSLLIPKGEGRLPVSDPQARSLPTSGKSTASGAWRHVAASVLTVHCGQVSPLLYQQGWWSYISESGSW